MLLVHNSKISQWGMKERKGQRASVVPWRCFLRLERPKQASPAPARRNSRNSPGPAKAGREAEGRRRGGNGSKNTYQPYLLSKETTPKRKTYIKLVIEE